MNKKPQSLIDQCFARLKRGESIAYISKTEGVSEETLRRAFRGTGLI